QPAQEPAFADVRSTDDGVLPGALPGNFVTDTNFLRMFAFLLDFFLQLAHARFEVSLHLFAGLVLGQKSVHFFQALQPVLGGLGLFVLGFGFQVLRGQVSGHDRSSVSEIVPCGCTNYYTLPVASAPSNAGSSS